MPIYQTGGYEVNPSAIPKVKQAIAEFVEYIKANEPGTEMYLAWQEAENPAKFLHLFIFKDEQAHEIHRSSDAVRKFGSVPTTKCPQENVRKLWTKNNKKL